MNQTLKTFLISHQAHFTGDERITFPASGEQTGPAIYPVSSLALLKVSGEDASTFLQGQITCNIDELTDDQGSFGAICTPQGRTISTFFVIRDANFFLFVLPLELLETISGKLQLYILRSDVKLESNPDLLCLTGIYYSDPGLAPSDFPEKINAVGKLNDGKVIRLPGREPRYLIIAPVETTVNHWQELISGKGFHPADSDNWSGLDIISGIPWLNSETTGEYTPQMLNLIPLNGVSFNKGCYTGQEVIARTHYKGKSKRTMYLLESTNTDPVAPMTTILGQPGAHAKVVGHVISSQTYLGKLIMQVVLQTDHAESSSLTIENRTTDHLSLSEFTY